MTMLSFRPEQVLELASKAKFNGLLSKRTISKWRIRAQPGDVKDLLKALGGSDHILGCIKVNEVEIRGLEVVRRVSGDIAFFVANHLDALAPRLTSAGGLDKLQNHQRDELYLVLGLARSISTVGQRWPGWLHPAAIALIKRRLHEVWYGSKKPPLSTFSTKLLNLINQIHSLAQSEQRTCRTRQTIQASR